MELENATFIMGCMGCKLESMVSTVQPLLISLETHLLPILVGTRIRRVIVAIVIGVAIRHDLWILMGLSLWLITVLYLCNTCRIGILVFFLSTLRISSDLCDL